MIKRLNKTSKRVSYLLVLLIITLTAFTGLFASSCPPATPAPRVYKHCLTLKNYQAHIFFHTAMLTQNCEGDLFIMYTILFLNVGWGVELKDVEITLAVGIKDFEKIATGHFGDVRHTTEIIIFVDIGENQWGIPVSEVRERVSIEVVAISGTVVTTWQDWWD